MKKRMIEILYATHKYNSEDLARSAFGFSKDIEYDALVVAPSFSQYKLELDKIYYVKTL